VSSILPGTKRAEPRCPKCDYRTRLVPNPYFASGLAVHRYLRACRRCDGIVIVRERPRAPAPSPDQAVVPPDASKPSAGRRGIWRRRRAR
jgi:DNA-directed RNA polymerase subunit RPC12/RpoP